uniref:Uncharacterized protein n=1 Tax=Anguilla anguilla TaxID=7936 RepID=A0A0E9UXE3_ANGAN
MELQYHRACDYFLHRLFYHM